MIEGDASAGGYTHILPGRWTPRSVGRACKRMCVRVYVYVIVKESTYHPTTDHHRLDMVSF